MHQYGKLMKLCQSKSTVLEVFKINPNSRLIAINLQTCNMLCFTLSYSVIFLGLVLELSISLFSHHSTLRNRKTAQNLIIIPDLYYETLY